MFVIKDSKLRHTFGVIYSLAFFGINTEIRSLFLCKKNLFFLVGGKKKSLLIHSRDK